jgi:hypothetical protein
MLSDRQHSGGPKNRCSPSSAPNLNLLPSAPHASSNHLGLAMPMAMRWLYAISVTKPISGKLSSDLVPEPAWREATETESNKASR